MFLLQVSFPLVLPPFPLSKNKYIKPLKGNKRGQLLGAETPVVLGTLAGHCSHRGASGTCRFQRGGGSEEEEGEEGPACQVCSGQGGCTRW